MAIPILSLPYPSNTPRCVFSDAFGSGPGSSQARSAARPDQQTGHGWRRRHWFHRTTSTRRCSWPRLYCPCAPHVWTMHHATHRRAHADKHPHAHTRTSTHTHTHTHIWTNIHCELNTTAESRETRLLKRTLHRIWHDLCLRYRSLITENRCLATPTVSMPVLASFVLGVYSCQLTR